MVAVLPEIPGALTLRELTTLRSRHVVPHAEWRNQGWSVLTWLVISGVKVEPWIKSVYATRQCCF